VSGRFSENLKFPLNRTNCAIGPMRSFVGSDHW
jgi:hypothetical protein